MEYEFELVGKLPSKKNRYTPRRDKPGVFKNSKLRDELDRLAMQIPGEVRDLQLENPDIEVRMTVANARSDRDSALTTLLDILVSMKVLKNDNAKRCNGMITLLPVNFSDDWRTTVRLTCR